MTYTVDEGIEDHEAGVLALREIKAAFPDAKLRFGLWTSESLSIDDADGFDLIESGEERYLLLCKRLNHDASVYMHNGCCRVPYERLFSAIRDDDRLRDELVSLLKRLVRGY